MNANTASKWEVIRHINGRPWSRMQIGWFTVTESKDFNQFGEYAADYWTATVAPGRYPIYAFRDCGTPWHSLGVSMPGTIKSGSWWNKRQPGESTTVHLNIYAHTLAAGVLAGTSPHVELLPGVEARKIDFEYDGEQKTTHGIFADGETV